MEFEQIVKRLEWLDEEHRKDKAMITTLGERLASIEGTLNALELKTRSISKDIAEATITTARLNQFNEVINKQRDDFSKEIAKIEERFTQREKELTSRQKKDLEDLNTVLQKFKASADPADIKNNFKVHAIEDQRLNQEIINLKQQIEEILRSGEEAQRNTKLLEETQRQDSKRMTDLQGEITSLRKRLDEHREKVQLNIDNLKVIDGRVNDILKVENERKKSVETFMDQHSLLEIDRERSWKEWSDKYQEFAEQNAHLESQIQSLDETLRAAKRAQDTYVDLNQKLERRINEITEMQRLGEDRLRQEWVTFRADDQKRWTGYTLSQEETLRNVQKDLEKFTERMTSLSDRTQIAEDQLNQSAEVTEKQLQEFMNVAHEWLSAYERIMGHSRKAR
ncbi:MAG: hypothetical protein JXA13_15340 [Anaerolineales bacterium]|nr:hypothetical protein [Anaerolineales bacterium]